MSPENVGIIFESRRISFYLGEIYYIFYYLQGIINSGEEKFKDLGRLFNIDGF